MQDSIAKRIAERGRGAQVLTLGELAHRQRVFMKEYLHDKADATKGTYNRCLNEFGRWVDEQGGYCPMTRGAMDDYREYLTVERNLGPRSVATYLTALRQFSKYLVKTGFLSQNPTKHLKISFGPVAQATQALSEEEVLLLLSVVDTGKSMGKRDMAIIFLMLYAGLTETDIERANISDIEQTLMGFHIRVQNKGSTRKLETVPLDRPVRKRIKDYLQTRPAHGQGDPLFLSHSNRSKGGRLHTRSIRRRITNYLDQAGLRRPGVTTQSLTLTALALWLNDGMSMDEIRLRVRTRKLAAKVQHLRQSGLVRDR